MTYRKFKHAVFKSWAFFFLEKHSRRFLRSDFHHSFDSIINETQILIK